MARDRIAAAQAMRQANDRLVKTDPRVRRVFRLLPLPLCIAFSLSAQAADKPPEDYSLCPVDDAVPFFPEAQAPTGAVEDRAGGSGEHGPEFRLGGEVVAAEIHGE